MNAPDTGDARIARAIAQASCCIQVYKVAERPGAGRKFFLARSVVTQLRCHRQSQWHPQLSDACEPGLYRSEADCRLWSLNSCSVSVLMISPFAWKRRAVSER